ncbi:cupin domain-containing protein [Clostridium luticellarii]|jgi:quercetin dioxygenase-like cupin family protein|uniref:Cupin domain protein n=1 Tax=Clostridium luticellarii TaxID=1691940 RepID=A0A2T0BHC2_9CLOT|nr:cupin domain-containing protein [Clostridium luticellarii]MCI1946404.1 cupin domain-containing protein [Clostridium luticellarii]MCI1969026.1 cupin domain-containing protein [Clostridium luticellarii]MCI1996216.1 cupin domain-containing protein [Clostridium luticellarii]MCI2040517.1 cupin domain-containing protein [Clostridium luticellarii]PRR83227.1 Cupin domain protein [Clostridium luticellarii]
MKNLIKNIQISKVLNLEGLISYNEGQVISRTIAQTPSVSITLFSLDKGEGISTHITDGDAMVQVLDGKAAITIGDETFNVNSGESIIMPSGVPHALQAVEKFKMLLTVVK